MKVNYIPIVIPLFITACVSLGTPVATYDWQFIKLRADASPQDKAFNECESSAKKRNRFIGNALIQIHSYIDDVQSCMRVEGCVVSKKPYDLKWI
jgi:hypothetical protein